VGFGILSRAAGSVKSVVKEFRDWVRECWAISRCFLTQGRKAP